MAAPAPAPAASPIAVQLHLQIDELHSLHVIFE
jgi:hypothetical protein